MCQNVAQRCFHLSKWQTGSCLTLKRTEPWWTIAGIIVIVDIKNFPHFFSTHGPNLKPIELFRLYWSISERHTVASSCVQRVQTVRSASGQRARFDTFLSRPTSLLSNRRGSNFQISMVASGSHDQCFAFPLVSIGLALLDEEWTHELFLCFVVVSRISSHCLKVAPYHWGLNNITECESSNDWTDVRCVSPQARPPARRPDAFPVWPQVRLPARRPLWRHLRTPHCRASPSPPRERRPPRLHTHPPQRLPSSPPSASRPSWLHSGTDGRFLRP